MAVIKSLLRVVAVVALTVSASTMAAIDTRQVPLLKRHVQRILSTQADDQAACDAAYENNTIAKQFLSDLPTDAGLRNCIASNFNPLLSALSASSTCTLTTIVSLAGGSSTGLDTFLEFFTALIGGGSTDLTTVLASWTSSTSTKNSAFCDAMNTQIGPCVETLLPVLVKILDDKGACCSQLADLYEVAKLVIPDGDTLDQALVPVVNGIHQTMCTSVGDTLCGQPLLTYVSNVVAKTQDTTLLGPLLFDAGLTLFALPDGDKACTAMDSTTFASRVSAKGGAVTSINLSCCASGFASLLKSFDALIAHLTGDTLATTLNLIAGLQDSTTQFKDPYSAFSYCTFKKTCTAPSFLLTAGGGSLNVTANSAKNASPKKIKCTSTKLCDQDETCSNVCKEGTVTIAPWVKRAISYQRNLSYDQSLCFTQLPATHNSGTTLARGWGNRDQLTNKILDASNANSYLRTNNQFLTLTDQLNLGARLVELDVHYYAKKLRDGHCSSIDFDILRDISKAIKRTTQTLLSAGASTEVVVEWEPSLMGCLPSLGGIKAENNRLHEDTVKEVAAWVKANPTELVIVYLDVGAEVNDFDQYANMEALHTAAFGSLLFSPADLKTAGGSWKSFTLSSLVSQGKRVILIANSGDAVAFDKSKLCDGWSDIPSGNATGAGTGTLWGKKLNSGSIVRAYASAIHYATMAESEFEGGAAKGTAAEPATVTATTLPVFVNAGVNILAADGLDGAVIEAMIWSWAANEPSRGDTAVEVSAKDGRWYGVTDKSSIANVACVSSSDRLSWELVAQGSSCPSGFTFGAPQRPVENTALVAVLKAKGAEATAQLNVDVASIPVISAAEEAAWATTDSPTTAPGSSGGGGGGSASAPALYTMAMTVASVGFVLTLVL